MLGWATIAMALFYLAWRYNVFFVTDTKIDTRGLIYPRAIKHLFTGIYLSEICMIGLFGASVAPGPLIMMVIFLIFTVLFHISLNSALNPLLYNLPVTLLAEEESRLLDPRASDPANGGPNTVRNPEKPVSGETSALDGAKNNAGFGPAQAKKGNFLIKFLKPWVYSDFHTLRTLVPQGRYVDPYAEDVVQNAYHPPSVTSATPLLWIPSDAAGVSKEEVAHTSKVIPITDEGCELDDKGKLVWDRETTRPPVWEEKPIY